MKKVGLLRTFAILKCTFQCWKALFEELGLVAKLPSGLRGRPRTIPALVVTAIKELFQTDSDSYLDELVWWLAFQHNVKVSRSALQRALVDAGLSRKMLHKIACERDENLREDFRQQLRELSNGTAVEFVCVDETSKNEHTVAWRYGRSPVGEPAPLIDPFVHGTCYSLVAALTLEGYIAMDVVEGSFDTEQFHDFIAERVVCGLFYYLLFLMVNTIASSNEPLARPSKCASY